MTHDHSLRKSKSVTPKQKHENLSVLPLEYLSPKWYRNKYIDFKKSKTVEN